MKLRHALAAAWIVLVAVLSLLPGDVVPAPEVAGIDRFAHVAFYAVMALALHNAVRRPSVPCGLAVTAACGAMGGALELGQWLVPGRTADVWDAVLNLVGAAAASALYVWLAARRHRQS